MGNPGVRTSRARCRQALRPPEWMWALAERPRRWGAPQSTNSNRTFESETGQLPVSLQNWGAWWPPHPRRGCLRFKDASHELWMALLRHSRQLRVLRREPTTLEPCGTWMGVTAIGLPAVFHAGAALGSKERNKPHLCWFWSAGVNLQIATRGKKG